MIERREGRMEIGMAHESNWIECRDIENHLSISPVTQ